MFPSSYPRLTPHRSWTISGSAGREDTSSEGFPGQSRIDRNRRRRANSGSPQRGTGTPRGRIRSTKAARVEAALFVADGALSLKRLVQVAVLADVREAAAIIAELNVAYESCRSAFRIEQVATGFQLLTRPDLVSWLDRLHSRQTQLRLSPPLMETLVVVAYRQPCTRADIEAIRGVQSAEIIKQLLDRQLIRVVGEDDSLGRPYLYGTTRRFIETFGLRSLDDLPLADSLKRPATPAKSLIRIAEESDSVSGIQEPSTAHSPIES